MTRTIQLYRTYSFKSKDPVIDELRTIMQDVGASYRDLCEGSGISTTTPRNWFEGDTLRPQHATIKAAARALGYDYKLVRSNEFHFERYEPTTRKQEQKKLSSQATSTIRHANKRKRNGR